VPDPLDGVEFRVFRALLQEYDYDTVEQLRVYLTQGPAASTEEIELALESLATDGYVEQYKPGHWKVASHGHAVSKSLLGELNS
jgi:hypothetical protein